MNRFVICILLSLSITMASAQGLVRGKVVDKNTEEPLSYVNVKVSQRGSETLLKGGVTDIEGKFVIEGLRNGDYTLTLTFVGYKTLSRQFTISAKTPTHHYATLFLSEDAHSLKEVTVTGQKSTMKLEVDRKSFDVSQLISNAGQSASEALENIPSVEVDNDGNVSLRGNTSVEVWINGKASGLTSDNRAQILQQLPAESIERIEVIDNPSAKFSAEGSAGIINIVLKKDRTPGYYGSVQAGVTTRSGANTSFNINYSSKLLDAFFNIGYRHRENKGKSQSEQTYKQTNQYQWYNAPSSQMGNNLFSRAGVTLHATTKDDFTLSGMLMRGRQKNWSSTLYHYGTLVNGSWENAIDTRQMLRYTRGAGDMNMNHLEFDYRHSFTERHFLDFMVSYGKWKSDNDNYYQDSTMYYDPVIGTFGAAQDYDYQYRPTHINNRSWEVKLDYENPISENLKVEAGYQGRFSHENTPQESFIDNTSWDGKQVVEDQAYYNRFIYDMDLHALYSTLTYKLDKFGVMAGLRGEYWKVNTESYTWAQEHDAAKRDQPFKKDYFQLFPSVFLSYQFTDNDQLQLNYTRRLRRPWGGQLNSFKDTRDATTVSFGNPELTPEYSNSFSLNYLKTWTEHSLMLSAYYRPTSDVIQRINWQNTSDGLMYSTNENVAKSVSEGLELVVKNHLFRILDLTTTANAYYYKLDGFSYDIDGQTITGKENHNFSFNARMMASVTLPYDISVQVNGRYRARQVITQGYRKPSYSMDIGLRKNFFNKLITLSINCRDVFNSRRWENFTESDTFSRHQLNRRNSRMVNFTLTYNFGNQTLRKRPQRDEQGEDDPSSNYNGGGEE
ncbi:MAG: TonB-dependent receptor [Prevotella sp.]|nr:TonB-dependent receptor [Prevotella sp.]